MIMILAIFRLNSDNSKHFETFLSLKMANLGKNQKIILVFRVNFGMLQIYIEIPKFNLLLFADLLLKWLKKPKIEKKISKYTLNMFSNNPSPWNKSALTALPVAKI